MNLSRRTLFQLGGLGALEHTLAPMANATSLVKEAYYHYKFQEHVYTAEHISTFGIERRRVKGCGIILNGHYVTVAHIPKWVNLRPEHRKTILYGKELKQKDFNWRDDVSIFELPYDLSYLQDFPAKTSDNFEVGDEVCVIGNHPWMGFNARRAFIFDSDGVNAGDEKMVKFTQHCFGLDRTLMPGDSGCPVLNPNFELLGLVQGGYYSLEYVKKIERFTRHLR